jgi:hypothetical protein
MSAPDPKPKTILELVERIKQGLPSLPAPPPDAEPPPKPLTEATEKDGEP